MKYSEILRKIKTLNNNLELAIARNDTQKARTYKYQINDLKLKKEKTEIENASVVLHEQEKIIVKLEEQLEGYNKINKELREEIDILQDKFKKLTESLNPKKEEPVPPVLFNCPKCGGKYTEEDMTEHQKNCKANPF